MTLSAIRLIASETREKIRTMKRRHFVLQFVSLGLVVTSALMIWKGLILLTRSDTPVVVVLSGSMEPAFQRGDILFLIHEKQAVELGDVVVFSVEGRSIPIVHRVIKTHAPNEKNEHKILTKGDNNYSDDIVLYAAGQNWLQEDYVLGCASGVLPLVGRLTIITNDYPFAKFATIGLLGFLVVTSNEQ